MRSDEMDRIMKKLSALEKRIKKIETEARVSGKKLDKLLISVVGRTEYTAMTKTLRAAEKELLKIIEKEDES